MAASLWRLGLGLLVGVFVVAILDEMLGIKLEFLNDALYRQVGMLALFMVAAGLLMSVLGGAGQKVVGKRCPRCGKRVPKKQTYCRDHQKKALDELRDRHRSTEDTKYGRRSG